MGFILWTIAIASLAVLIYYYRDTIAGWLPGWKTYIWNGFIAASSVIVPILDELRVIDWSQWITSPKHVAMLGLSISVVGIVLRAATR